MGAHGIMHLSKPVELRNTTINLDVCRFLKVQKAKIKCNVTKVGNYLVLGDGWKGDDPCNFGNEWTT